ncbi:MAG TPA: AmmeMemoRadiSam system radical SAM enzyme [Bacteroidetes bacterium]|nr:AmmeMemoRadiSam system radical SAM enzyme [Bacteroidota bacterium]
MKAAYFTSLEENKIRCMLCPHNCLLKPGETGKCKVRHNIDGTMQTDVYENVSALALDPIEKKPLYHFYPGTQILSVGSFGCNMQCPFCQNYEISQPSVSIMNRRKNHFTSRQILHEAQQISSNTGLAFTYNEPIVWYEFMMEMAVNAKKSGLSTVMVSNGYINRAPLLELIKYIDAFNIDLKAFNNDFYRQYTGAGIKPVLNTLKDIQSGGKYLEITYLVIPDYNDMHDEFRDCINWINDNLGPDIVLHLSRYFPNYNFSAPPTPSSTLKDLFYIAREKLNFVYPGNINITGIMDTVCPDCGSVITSRSGYRIKHLNTEDGSCSKCGRLIYRHFSR